MKIFTGKVIHTKMEKTVKVDVTQIVSHPLYGKRMKKTKLYLVHDELGAKEGDVVQFVACKPISKRKKWKVTEIVTGKTKKAKKTEKKADSKDEDKNSKKKKAKKTAKKAK